MGGQGTQFGWFCDLMPALFCFLSGYGGEGFGDDECLIGYDSKLLRQECPAETWRYCPWNSDERLGCRLCIWESLQR